MYFTEFFCRPILTARGTVLVYSQQDAVATRGLPTGGRWTTRGSTGLFIGGRRRQHGVHWWLSAVCYRGTAERRTDDGTGMTMKGRVTASQRAAALLMCVLESSSLMQSKDSLQLLWRRKIRRLRLGIPESLGVE